MPHKAFTLTVHRDCVTKMRKVKRVGSSWGPSRERAETRHWDEAADLLMVFAPWVAGAMLAEEGERCTRRKCGEYNPLRCARQQGHSGECAFVVDTQEQTP